MQSNRRLPLPRAALCFALGLGLSGVAAAATSNANITSLLAFGTVTSTGAAIRADAILATDGNFYVAASAGGTSGAGSIIRITPTGTATLVHALTGGAEGNSPYAALMQAADGALYGTTYLGGSGNLGTIFKVTLDDTFTNLHSFDNSAQGGFLPYGGLVQLAGGDLYGTTLRGGTNDAGTVFRITTGGSLTTLHSFNGADGRNPEGRLAVGPDGALYGTTLVGGASDRGTIFRLASDGTLATLYSFPALGAFNDQGVATNAAGSNPRAGLTLGTDGNFYGTAYQGGEHGYGTVFRVTPGGTLTPLHSFRGTPGEGAFPLSTISQLADGSLVGTTERGGTLGAGSAWRIDSTGVFQTLHSFSTLANDGSTPYATLTPANGALYGVTFSDQVYNAGVFFRLDLPGTGGLPVTLTSTPDTIALGASATLTWSAPAATSCTTSGAFGEGTVATSGTQTPTPTSAGIYNFIITCVDAASVAHTTSVPLTVTTPALEPVDGGGDGGGGAFPLLGLALLAGTLGHSLMRKHPFKDAA